MNFLNGFDLWQLIIAATVLFLPGAGIWCLFSTQESSVNQPPWWLRWSRTVAALADMLALSIALTSLLGLLGFITGLRWDATILRLFYSGCAIIVLFWTLWKFIRLRRIPGFARQLGWTAAGCLVTIAALGAMIAWRLHQARGLALPLWVDSVHHALIVRVIAEVGGVPATLDPYLPVPFYYHYGFHLLTALFVNLSGMGAPQAVLWFGQIWIGLMGLAVFRFTWALRDESEGGVSAARALLAALLTAFVFQMPGYYLTWGRYTLTAGLLVAAAALAYWIELQRASHPQRRSMVITAILMGGLFLTHYLAALLVGLYAGILFLAALVNALRRHSRPAWAQLWRIPLVGGMGALAASPWLWRVWIFEAQRATLHMVTPLDGATSATNTPDYWNYIVYLLGPRHNHILLGIALVGALLALRRPVMRPFVVWAFLLAFLSQPWSLRLGPFRPDLFTIVLFFPAAAVLADLLTGGAAAFKYFRLSLAGKVLWGILTILLVVWGLRETYTVVNPVTVLATQADVAALDWINYNVPANAYFLINSAEWQSTRRGVDGAFWIMPYTGRATLPPPVIYSWGSPDWVAQIRAWNADAQTVTGCTQAFWNLVRSAGLTHLYLRTGAGALQARDFTDCPRVVPVYDNAGVTILQILTP